MTTRGLIHLWFGLHAPVSRTAEAPSGFGLIDELSGRGTTMRQA
jgi:hypothetical protein